MSGVHCPLVSIIIPARPGEGLVPAASKAMELDWPQDRLEVLVVRGRQPSAQRNAAIGSAKGEWIYFLDDDSLADPANLQRAARHFADTRVQMVGGPNKYPPESPLLEQAFGETMGNKLAFGPSAARYRPMGVVRETDEKELILCNLVARRQAVIDAGGFDESLYPNEENALMDELQKSGGVLLYDPEFVVWRRPRTSLKAFCKMLFTYGRGRAEQFRLYPTAGSILNFVPPLFCAYLAFCIMVLFGIPNIQWVRGIVTGSLLFYASVVMISAGFGARPELALRVAPLITLAHVCYGAGFWRGLFTSLKRTPGANPPEVFIESVTG